MYSTDLLLNIVNGDMEDYDIKALAEHIQELYDNAKCLRHSMMIS